MTGNEKEPGIDGGLGKRTEAEPSTVNTIDVSSVDEYVKIIVKNGGSIIRPKMPVPGVGWMAYFKDPEGNLWGIMQTDKNAKWKLPFQDEEIVFTQRALRAPRSQSLCTTS